MNEYLNSVTLNIRDCSPASIAGNLGCSSMLCSVPHEDGGASPQMAMRNDAALSLARPLGFAYTQSFYPLSPVRSLC